ncbi:MAG: DUF1893 domain-containing protein [candidate division WOR-3 bacterium]|uniref:DUF1893 domain-containing protein n=1 Tax=candidate division WOR-3 bacterium TaxID=2052148 RepID=A0A7C1NP40_UNCW3|nr:DUF1893 domain-containing protein [candidate division WOR-3 bacterium]
MAVKPHPFNRTRAEKLLRCLDSSGWSLFIIRGNSILFSTDQPGVRPLLAIARKFRSGLAGATVVDRVVGICAARVFCHLRASSVVARTLSRTGLDLLAQFRIPCFYQELVEHIRNRAGSDICPFEKLASKIPEPGQLLREIEKKIKKGGTGSAQNPPVVTNLRSAPGREKASR